MEVYEGEIEIPSIWSVPNDKGEKLRRIRIVATYPEGGYIYEELPSKFYPRGYNDLRRTPEFNLRYVFRPED